MQHSQCLGFLDTFTRHHLRHIKVDSISDMYQVISSMFKAPAVVTTSNHSCSIAIILSHISCNQFLVFMTVTDFKSTCMRPAHLTDPLFANGSKPTVINSSMCPHGQPKRSSNALSWIEYISVCASLPIRGLHLNHATIVINLGGYTKGSKNKMFAVRPSPVQISLMGFAGTLAAGHFNITKK
jgi:hypothetical protein